MYKKGRDARAKLLFCLSKPIALLPFSLPSSSSLRKLPSNSHGTPHGTRACTKMAFFRCQQKTLGISRLLASAFSLKIRLVLISSSAIANHDVIITIETRREKNFFAGLRPRFSRLVASLPACLGFACCNFAKKNKRLLAVYGICCVLMKNIYIYHKFCYSYD